MASKQQKTGKSKETAGLSSRSTSSAPSAEPWDEFSDDIEADLELTIGHAETETVVNVHYQVQPGRGGDLCKSAPPIHLSDPDTVRFARHSIAVHTKVLGFGCTFVRALSRPSEGGTCEAIVAPNLDPEAVGERAATLISY